MDVSCSSQNTPSTSLSTFPLIQVSKGCSHPECPALIHENPGVTDILIQNLAQKQDVRKSFELRRAGRQDEADTAMRNNVLQNLVASGKQYKILPYGDDGWWTITPLRREYASSRSNPKAQALEAIPEGTIIGPVLEVHIVKILDGCGIEVAIPSTANPMDTSYVVISRETAFCAWNSFIGPVATCPQTFKDQEGVTSMKEREEPRASRKLVLALSCAFIRWRILGSRSIQDGYKNAASLWPRWKTNWWFKTLGYN